MPTASFYPYPLAAGLAVAVSFFIYWNNTPWGRRLFASVSPWPKKMRLRFVAFEIMCYMVLVTLLRRWIATAGKGVSYKDGTAWSVTMTIMFACMEAPRMMHTTRNWGLFVVQVAHNLVVLLVTLTVLINLT